MRVRVVACFLIVCGIAACAAADSDQIDDFKQDLTAALADMGLTTADLRIRHDYAEPDAFRLPLVDSLMHDPASLLEQVENLADGIEAESLVAEVAYLLWDAMSVEPDDPRGESHGRAEIKDATGRLAHLQDELRHALSTYLNQLRTASDLRARAVSGVQHHLDFLRANYPALVIPSEEYEQAGPFELYDLEKAEEALTDSVLKVSEAVDIGAVASMTYVAIQAAEDIRVEMEHLLPLRAGYVRYRGGKAAFNDHRVTVTGKIAYLGLTEFGPVVIGGPGRNKYSGCFALIVDPGGDDVYELTHQGEIPFRLIVDEAGNDIYESSGSIAVAGAVFGTSIIMDREGSDTYRSGDISLGAGICGAGLLLDAAGDDSYSSGGFSQGAGFLGLGILRDGGGNDTYVAEMQSQAFGYVMGSGLLLDRAGHDTYLTTMAQTDFLRYDDHFLTLSQGCAFGSRPDYSGGIGLLIDSAGNDLYSSDIFGQGVAYWFAVGALIDRGGHDRYCSYQYAQGAGIHLAFGLLVDESGDDYYQSKGVSQGCGHDLSLGLLADFSGNDCFTAIDLSQGAGNANGTGILYDADGMDSYSAKNKVNVNGYGDYRREFGSVGVYIDARGRDFYSARGTDESLWESGKYGLGMDIPGEAGSPRGDLKVNQVPFEARAFTPRELFILSSRGEPRFSAWRKFAFDTMVEDSLQSIEYLRTVLDTKDARERHTIKDILRDIGEPAVPMLCDAVREDGERAQIEAAWILGLIGSKRAFDALLELSHTEAWRVRSGALDAIARLSDLTADEKSRLTDRITSVLSAPDEVFYVKKDAAFAAGNQNLCDLTPLLVESLTADHYSVRFAACEAIRRLSEIPCEDLVGALLARMPGSSPRTLVAMLYAAHQLPVAGRLDIAKAALDLPQREYSEVALAIARLVLTVEPETEDEEQRLERITARIPREFWGVDALLGAAVEGP